MPKAQNVRIIDQRRGVSSGEVTRILGGSTTGDHGALAGLADDDHAQYILATGARAGATAQAQQFTSGLIAPLLKPASDSTTALQLQTNGGTAVITLDTTNIRTSITGRLMLEDSTTSNKAVYVGTNRFLHNFHHPTGDTATPLGRNVFLGEGAGNFTLGSGATATNEASQNVGVGNGALASLTLGYDNLAFGYAAGNGITTGANNVAVGSSSLITNQTGSNNFALGSNALRLATGSSNIAIGYTALYNLGAGNGSIAIGERAGRFQADGSTALTTTTNSIYIGYLARGKDNSDSNSIVIAGTTGIGLGANTTVLGNSSTTYTRIFGQADTDGLIVNEGGNTAATYDLRAESDTETNMLWLDASADLLYLGGSTNGVQIAKGGHLTLLGTARVWDDIRIEPSVRGTGVNVPTFSQWFTNGAGSRGVYLYTFDNAVDASEKEVHFTCQLPHAWAATPIHIHVHWIAATTAATSKIRWGLEYTWAEPLATYGNTTLIYATDPEGGDTGTTQYKHMITEFAAMTPSATQDGFSSTLICRLWRDSSDAADTYTGDVGLLYIDAHIELDKLGSNDEYA